MVNQMVGFISSYSTPDPAPAVHGWALAVAFFLVGLVYTFAQGLWNLAMNRGATKLRSFMVRTFSRWNLKPLELILTVFPARGNLQEIDTRPRRSHQVGWGREGLKFNVAGHGTNHLSRCVPLTSPKFAPQLTPPTLSF